MHGSDAPRTRRTRGRLHDCAALVLVLAACTQAPATPTLTASEAGNPNPTGGPIFGASASESEEASPSTTQSGTLSGTWAGTWVIDGYGNTGDFTMELVQTGGSFSGTIESTNTDCPSGTVDGTVDGTDVTFGWVLTGVPVQFEGVLNGTSMSGTWSSNACSDAELSLTGTWEATKQS